MEVIITIAAIIVLMLFIGFKLETILMCGLVVIALFIVLMFLLFSYSLFRMITGKKVEAKFTKIDKISKRKFDAAYYEYDGEEYPCAFPSEPIMRKKIYSDVKNHIVRFNKKTKCVYDRYASLTCVIGFIFSAVLTAGVLYFAALMLNFI